MVCSFLRHLQNIFRCEQGSNLRGKIPLDFKSNALTTRPSQHANHQLNFQKRSCAYVTKSMLFIHKKTLSITLVIPRLHVFWVSGSILTEPRSHLSVQLHICSLCAACHTRTFLRMWNFVLKIALRSQQDSNLRGQSPTDF